MNPCNPEEADARIFDYVKEFVLKDHMVVLVDTVDLDVVVIAISCFNELSQFGLEKLWIKPGVGISKRWISIHDLTAVLGIESAGLLFWHSFTDSNTLSAFGGKKNYQCRKHGGCFMISCLSLKNNHTAANTFKSKDEDIRILKRFTSLHYSTTTTFESMNKYRHHLFTKQGRQVDTIPPTKDVLLQHNKRVKYQAKLSQTFMPLIKVCLE